MQPSEIHHAVEVVFRTLMEERGTPLSEVDHTRVLYDGGYGLDSMDTATLSAMLSEKFDDDPYSSGTFPSNIAEVIQYYTERAVAS